MQACDGTLATNQCKASTLCNVPDWHLCTVHEFRQRGGEKRALDGEAAWIAGCVREGYVLPALTLARPCLSCDPTGGVGAVVQKDCTSAFGQPCFDLYVGVVTSGVCHRLAPDGLQGMWATERTALSLARAVCCR
jgi:hypothetical protein